MLNEFGSYNGALDTSKNDLTRKPCERNYCANGADLGRAPNLPDPSASWNYPPYLGNFCNYYSNNSYELGNVHQYDNQKCGTQFPRNYPQHPSISSASVLQCCDPRCQLLSEHSKYPFNHALHNKINQRTKRSKSYYSGILDLPKPPPDPVKTDHVNKYASAIPYPSLRNDLNAKYSGQQTDYAATYENSLKPSKHILLPEAPSFGEYYTDIGKPAYWTKQNLWNRNVTPSYYPTYEHQDKGYNQKMPVSVHDQVAATSNNGRGILFNRLLDHRERPYDPVYMPNYYYPKQNQFPKGVGEYGQSCSDRDPLCGNVTNNTRLPAPTNSYQCLPSSYSVHYPGEVAPSDTANCYKENLLPPKPVEKPGEQKTRILDKNPNLDVREFLSTWDDVEDDKLPEAANESQSPQPEPVIVLDCTTLEGDVLAKVKEKLGHEITSLDGNGPNVCQQFESGSGAAVLKIIENDNVSPHTSVIQDTTTTTTTAVPELKERRVDQKFAVESSHLNSDGFLTWYSSNSKKKDDLSYDLVEMTERLVNTVDKLFNEPEKKNAPKMSSCEPQYESRSKDVYKYGGVGPTGAAENEWNVNFNYKKGKSFDKCSNGAPSVSGDQLSQYQHQNSFPDASSAFRNYQSVAYDQQRKESLSPQLPVNEKNVSCSLNLSKTSNDFKFSVNYSKQASEYNLSKLQDFSIKYKNSNGYPCHYQKYAAAKVMPTNEGEFYKNNYINYSSCRYDNGPYAGFNGAGGAEIMATAGEKECTINYVEHIDKAVANETDITLVKADLEKSLNEITHQFSYHKQKSANGEEKSFETLQEHDMLNDRTKPAAEAVAETAAQVECSYEGVIQKTGACGATPYEEPICDNSLLSMPSLSPPSSPRNVHPKSISSVNLTLNDVYENDVIFDTEESNVKEPEMANGSKEESVVVDNGYQPLNLALSRDLKTGDGSSQQHKAVTTPSLLSPMPPFSSASPANEENQTCAENTDGTSASNTSVSKVGDRSVETDHDLKANHSSDSGLREMKLTEKTTAPYQTCIVSLKQYECQAATVEDGETNRVTEPSTSEQTSPVVEDLSTSCSLQKLQTCEPGNSENSCTSSSSRDHKNNEIEHRSHSPHPCNSNDANNITGTDVAMEETKLPETSAQTPTLKGAVDCENRVDDPKSIPAPESLFESSKCSPKPVQVTPETKRLAIDNNDTEKPASQNGTEPSTQPCQSSSPVAFEEKTSLCESKVTAAKVKVNNENKLADLKTEPTKKYKHKHKRLKLKRTNDNDSEPNSKPVSKTDVNCNALDIKTELQLVDPANDSVIKENDGCVNRVDAAHTECSDSHQAIETPKNGIEKPSESEQNSVPFDDRPTFKMPTLNGYCHSESDTFAKTSHEVPEQKSEGADDKLVQVQNLSADPEYTKMKKRKFAGTNLPMKKRKQDLDLIRMATETSAKWSPTSSATTVAEIENHIKENGDDLCDENLEKSNVISRDVVDYKHYKKLHKKERKTKKKFKKRQSRSVNGQQEQNKRPNLSESGGNPRATFKRSKSWTQFTEYEIRQGETSLNPDGRRSFSHFHESDFSRSKTPPPVSLNSTDWRPSIPSPLKCFDSTVSSESYSKGTYGTSPNSCCRFDRESHFHAPGRLTYSPNGALSDIYDSDKEDQEPVREAVDDEMFNIPSIAPTPNCDLIRDDNADFEAVKSDQPDSPPPVNSKLGECKDPAPPCFAAYSAPTPNCSLKHDYLDEGHSPSASSDNQLRFSMAGYGDEGEMRSSKAPSPNFMLTDHPFANEKESSKAPSPYCDLMDGATVDAEEEERNYSSGVSDMSSPTSVAPSPKCDIIEGVLLDDSDYGKVNDDYAVDDAEAEKDGSNCSFEKTSTTEPKSNQNDPLKTDNSAILNITDDKSDLDVESAEKVKNFTDNQFPVAVVTSNTADELSAANSSECPSEGRGVGDVERTSAGESGVGFPDHRDSTDSDFESDLKTNLSSDDESDGPDVPKYDQSNACKDTDENVKSISLEAAECLADALTHSNTNKSNEGEKLCLESHCKPVEDVTNDSQVTDDGSSRVHRENPLNETENCANEDGVAQREVSNLKNTSKPAEPYTVNEFEPEKNISDSQTDLLSDSEREDISSMVSSIADPNSLPKNELSQAPKYLVSDEFNKNEVSEATSPVNDELPPSPNYIDDSTDTNEMQAINIVLDEDESDPHTVPSLRSLAFRVLAEIRSARDNLAVFFTPERTEIVIHAEHEDSMDATLTDSAADMEAVTDAAGDANPVTDAAILDADGCVSSCLDESPFDYPHLELSDMSPVRNQNEKDSQCQCFVISNEEPITCLRCSLNCSIVVNDDDQIDGVYHQCCNREYLRDDIDDDSCLLENDEHSCGYFSYDCIEESFIDQNVNFTPQSNADVTLEDTCSFPPSELADNENAPDTSKFQIKVQLPWHKIFNLGDENDIQCQEPKILELGPAQIEVRLSSDDSVSWKSSSSNNENSSPVVKVKRLVIQRRQLQMDTENGPQPVSNTIALVEDSTSQEKPSSPSDGVKNEEDTRPVPRIPKMVIRKTSYRGYKSYLSPNDELQDELQPVVRLFKSKSLDELALRFSGENGTTTININKIERSLTDCGVHYKDWPVKESESVEETPINDGRTEDVGEDQQLSVESRISAEVISLKDEKDAKCGVSRNYIIS